jgi:polyphosphate kinase
MKADFASASSCREQTDFSRESGANLFINRELSWLQFNARVLEEAEDLSNPLLERLKFLAIYAHNLDEFFMIRVSALFRQLRSGALSAPPDGLTPAEQLRRIDFELAQQHKKVARCWRRDLIPKLKAQRIYICNHSQLSITQQKALRQVFLAELFPALTPLAFDPGHPFPHISNLSLNLAVVVNDPVNGERFARLKVPDPFPRFLPVPETKRNAAVSGAGENYSFVRIEEVIGANLDQLFPGLTIQAAYPFRVIRDADLEIEEDEASDLLACIQESVEMRQFGSVVRLEVNHKTPDLIREILIRNLRIAPFQLYPMDDPIGMADLMELTALPRPDLKYPPFAPAVPDFLNKEENIFTLLKRRNMLLYHPYQSFNPVVDFIAKAAEDPEVLAIKQTLYRVGSHSPVIDALLRARENGKQVAVLVELKARFDEEHNISWAQALERAGVHVTYGIVGLKTHAKMCLVVRREPAGITRYVHLGTGNYNAVTSKIYTDLSYFSSDPEITSDVSDLFNALTGYSMKNAYRKLWVAPQFLRKQIIDRIDREIAHQRSSGNGRLIFKMNSLVDQECIQALYRASQAGVRIDLQIRGICCLRPGIPGYSDNIRVTSIVGRFLEHSRIFCFHNNGHDQVFLGSADLMPRNLDRRIEVLFPVEDPSLRKVIIEQILPAHLRDDVKSRVLAADGSYRRLDGNGFNSQQSLLEWQISHTSDPLIANRSLYKLVAATSESQP